MEPHELADRIDAVGAALARVSTTVTELAPGARVFGGDGPGRVGELGRTLHLNLVSGLVARGREAAAHGARLADTADDLRVVAARYADVEASAERRHDGGGS